jgi:hypothetical protein
MQMIEVSLFTVFTFVDVFCCIWYESIKLNFYSYIDKGNIKLSVLLTDMNCGYMFWLSLAIVMSVQITLNAIYTEHNTLAIQSTLRPFFKINMFL